jgi:hypothetical protein
LVEVWAPWVASALLALRPRVPQLERLAVSDSLGQEPRAASAQALRPLVLPREPPAVPDSLAQELPPRKLLPREPPAVPDSLAR